MANVDEIRQELARRNRDLMPETARMVDAWKKRFGADTRFVYVVEGNEVRGAPLPLPQRSMNADEWLRYVKTGEVPEGKEHPCSASA